MLPARTGRILDIAIPHLSGHILYLYRVSDYYQWSKRISITDFQLQDKLEINRNLAIEVDATIEKSNRHGIIHI